MNYLTSDKIEFLPLFFFNITLMVDMIVTAVIQGLVIHSILGFIRLGDS